MIDISSECGSDYDFNDSLENGGGMTAAPVELLPPPPPPPPPPAGHSAAAVRQRVRAQGGPLLPAINPAAISSAVDIVERLPLVLPSTTIKMAADPLPAVLPIAQYKLKHKWLREIDDLSHK
jgi:hypothetical protein